MRIANERPIRELQADFNSVFPFLEISFFKPNDSAPVAGLRVGEARQVGGNGQLFLNGDLSAGAMERTIEDVFGLRTSIGCRFGQCQHSDKATKTLNQLNHKAMKMAEHTVII